MLPYITLKPLYHRKEEQLAFVTTDLQTLEPILRTVPGIKYNLTHQCWHLPMNKHHYEFARMKLHQYACLDLSLLKPYLEERARILKVKQAGGVNGTMQLTPKGQAQYNISADNFKQLGLAVTTLKLMAYSQSTLELYRNELLYLMRLLKDRYIGDLGAEQIRAYCLWLLETRKLSEAKVHTTINALKFYFEKVLHRSKLFIEVPRPKKPLQLPAVWSAEVIKQLLNATKTSSTKLCSCSATPRDCALVKLLAYRSKTLIPVEWYFMYAGPKAKRIGWSCFRRYCLTIYACNISSTNLKNICLKASSLVLLTARVAFKKFFKAVSSIWL